MKATTCTIDECEKPHSARGWCEMHYSRWRKNGSPHIAQTLTPKLPPALDRWWQRVDKQDGGCWEWTGVRFSNGYGRFREPITRRQQLAHRWGYQQLVGPVDPDLDLDHLCRNKGCVNPDHLEPVTHAENVRRWQVTRVVPTHCHKGHEYTAENSVYFGSPPRRRCVKCREIVAARRYGGNA